MNSIDEILEGPGFLMAQKGRHIFIESKRTQEDREIYYKAFSIQKRRLKLQSNPKYKKLKLLILEHNPFDIIANISLINSIHNAEEFKDKVKNKSCLYRISCIALSNPHL